MRMATGASANNASNNATAESLFSDDDKLAVICIFSILAAFCILTNTLVCYVITTQKTTDGALKYYVFSLAITDILVGAVCIPLYLVKEFTDHPEWNLLDSFSTAFDVFLGSCSIIHLCVMALDRVLSVTKPLLHRTKLRRKNAALTFLIIPWSIALLFAVIPFTQKSKDFEHVSAIALVSLIPIPCAFIIACYAKIYYSVTKRNNRSQRNSLTFYRVSQKRMTKTLFCVIIVFIICWMPLALYYCLPEGSLSAITSNAAYWIYYWAKVSSYFNSMCNSFIYAIFNPVFRTGLRDFLRHCFGKSGGLANRNSLPLCRVRRVSNSLSKDTSTLARGSSDRNQAPIAIVSSMKI